MKQKIKNDGYMDCVHTRACRRLCCLARQQTGLKVLRGCNRETCTAYESKSDLLWKWAE